jgi:hypothetical protein
LTKALIPPGLGPYSPPQQSHVLILGIFSQFGLRSPLTAAVEHFREQKRAPSLLLVARSPHHSQVIRPFAFSRNHASLHGLEQNRAVPSFFP